MEQYISKSAIVAEIERRIQFFTEQSGNSNSDIVIALFGLKFFLDTLDVKDVQEEPVSEDFEKKFISFVNATHDNNGSYSLHDFAQKLYNIAKEELKEPVSEDLDLGCDVIWKGEEPISESLK